MISISVIVCHLFMATNHVEPFLRQLRSTTSLSLSLSRAARTDSSLSRLKRPAGNKKEVMITYFVLASTSSSIHNIEDTPLNSQSEEAPKKFGMKRRSIFTAQTSPGSSETDLLSTCLDPASSILIRDSTPYLQMPRPGSQCLFGRDLVIGA